MDDGSNDYAIRCNADDEHTIKQVKYNKCGALLGAVPKDKEADLKIRCPKCGTWFHITKEPEDMVINYVQLKTKRFNFLQPVRIGR